MSTSRRIGTSRARIGLLGVPAALLAIFAIGAAPVYAKVTHVKQASFDGADAPGGPFGPLLVSDAVDQSSGAVYVTESNFFELGQGVVDKFNATGEYAKVQIKGAKIPSQKTFSLGFASGVAVDNSTGATKGDVYVADTENGVLDRFSEAGVFLCQITGKTPASAEEEEHECNGAAGSLTPDGSIKPSGVAVDISGDVYLADGEHRVIDKFSSEGAYLRQINDPHLLGEIGAIALDSENNLYAQVEMPGFGSSVIKFDPAGSFSSVLDAHETSGLGVDSKTNHVYVSEGGEGHEQIAEYEPSGALLSVIATPKATIFGIAVDGASGKIYAAELGTGEVSIFGPDIVIPTVTTTPATNVSETSATLNGHLDPDTAHGGGEVGECVFEYGTSSAYGHTAPCSPPAPYSLPADISAAVSGLQHGSTYHFRVKATNVNGTSESEDETFTTAGLAVIDSATSYFNGKEATLTAQINPSHLDTTCELQYVEDASFKSSGYATATTLPCTPEDLGAGFGDVQAKVTLTGLKIATTYHYRFLATNQAGLTGSGDQTFITFGANPVQYEVIDEAGHPYTQAAGHPYEVRVHFTINAASPNVAANVKDVISQLPPGLIGDPSATPKCTRSELGRRGCSGAAQVGVIVVNSAGEQGLGFVEPYALYNIVPPEGVAAEFGATFKGVSNAYIDARLRSDGDYGVTAEGANVPNIIGISEVFLRFWGVPADESHDALRRCPGSEAPCAIEDRVLKPFLRNPTSCGGPLTTTFAFDSWQAPGQFDEHAISTPAITGCDRVGFSPSLQVAPTSSQADSPTGLHVDLHIPQDQACESGPPVSCELAQADLKDTKVTLPAGLSANPSAANGLQACSPVQVGLTSAPAVTPVTFTADPAQCPDAAKVGTVSVDTPLLDHPLPGAVYIATPYDNPFGSLLAIYIAIYDPQTGVVVKLAGHVEPDPQTGQLTTTFSDSPQVPFEDFKLDFFAGTRAALATPEACGTYATSASFTSWSTLAPVSPEITPFPISAGCVSGFSPSFSAGAANLQAGAFTPFTLSFSRADTDQQVAGLSVGLPSGLLAKIAGVARCSDAALAAAAASSGAAEQANPSCPAGSLLGTVQTGAGAGEDPFFLSGKIYLTGPYNGGPYGLAVVVPAVAGPFDLGTVVVRQSLRIDPQTAQVTAVSDPLPTILKGIPIRLRRVDATIDRPGFTLNPTNCNPKTIAGSLTSIAGLSAPVSQRFQVGGCGALTFKPGFKAFTSGTTSKANGASLTVKVTAKPGEANIAKVALQLPLALPSRLTTLQKACSEAQFDANPAGCPEGSNVGTATAVTPVLNVPLTGPAYLVSHGAAAFPDVEFVLQGEGVRIILDGKTDIKKGITYSRFETVPDAPISSFETTFPQGPHSVLAANGNLCAATTPVTVKKRVAVRRHGRVVHVRRPVKRLIPAPLLMPTSLTAQNGAVLTQATKIAVTGCPKAKKTASSTRRHKRGKHHNK
jgi:hypothetical protein